VGFRRPRSPLELGGACHELPIGGGGNGTPCPVLALTIKYRYNAVELKPKGGMASAPTNVFGSGDWSSLTFFPTLVSDGGKPLLIFEGARDTNGTDPYSRSCIIGDLLTPGGWTLQNWSLSANCTDDHFGATVTGNGTLAAAWPAGTGYFTASACLHPFRRRRPINKFRPRSETPGLSLE
jgi:hypothetical protein